MCFGEILYFSGDNERLEFLGDSIVKFIVSDLVFRHFPDHQEGHLTVSFPLLRAFY